MTKPTAICVFCGSNFGNKRVYRETASRFGQLLAENGIRLVYGGGGVGLMGAAAMAAHDAGGHVTGIVPRALARIELQYQDADKKIVTENMHERKKKMFDLSDAFVVLPGGIGTLEETVELLSWAYLGFHDKPLVLVNVQNYWDPFLKLVRHMIDDGFAKPELLNTDPSRRLVHVVKSVDEVLPLLARILKDGTKTLDPIASTVC